MKVIGHSRGLIVGTPSIAAEATPTPIRFILRGENPVMTVSWVPSDGYRVRSVVIAFEISDFWISAPGPSPEGVGADVTKLAVRKVTTRTR